MSKVLLEGCGVVNLLFKTIDCQVFWALHPAQANSSVII